MTINIVEKHRKMARSKQGFVTTASDTNFAFVTFLYSKAEREIRATS